MAIGNNDTYFGKYRGIVVDDADPEQLGRIQTTVPAILGDQTLDWAMPCLPAGGKGNEGIWAIPGIGAHVWLEFEGGDLERPVWTGVYWTKDDAASQETEGQHNSSHVAIKTRSGQQLVFEDEENNENFRIEHPCGTKISINNEGIIKLENHSGCEVEISGDEISLTHNDGSRLQLDSDGFEVVDNSGRNTISMTPSGIKVSGVEVVIEAAAFVHLGGSGGSPVIKGTEFIQQYMAHTHITTAPGSPTSPPTTGPLAVTSLSTKVFSE